MTTQQFRNFAYFFNLMRVSVKLIILVSGLATVFSCNKKEESMSPVEIHAKVDSIVKTKEKDLKKQAQEDLNHRLSIEMKPKVDSILNRTSMPDSMLPALDTSGMW